jgi:hypothetical protein
VAAVPDRRSVVERNYRDLIEKMFQRHAPELQTTSATTA